MNGFGLASVENDELREAFNTEPADAGVVDLLLHSRVPLNMLVPPRSPHSPRYTDYVKPRRSEAIIRLKNNGFASVIFLLVSFLTPLLPSPWSCLGLLLWGGYGMGLWTKMLCWLGALTESRPFLLSSTDTWCSRARDTSGANVQHITSGLRATLSTFTTTTSIT